MKKENYAKMRQLGYNIKVGKNPLFGKVRDAEKNVRYWMDGNKIVCYVGEEAKYLYEKEPFNP